MTTDPVRVLIVDRDPDFCVMLYDALEQEGFAVSAVPGPCQAIDFCASDPPDVVVSEMRRPDTDRLALLDRVKSRWPATRVILISPDADWELFHQVVLRGGDDLLPKSSRPDEVLRAVRNATEGWREPLVRTS